MVRIDFIRLVRVESTTELLCSRCANRAGLYSKEGHHRRCAGDNSPTANCDPVPESCGLVASLRLGPVMENQLANMRHRASRRDMRTESEREHPSRRDVGNPY